MNNFDIIFMIVIKMIIIKRTNKQTNKMEEYEYEEDEYTVDEESTVVHRPTTNVSNSVIHESFMFEGSKYFSLNEDEVFMMIHKRVEELSHTLSLSINSTFLLLIDNKWNEDKIFQSLTTESDFLKEYKDTDYIDISSLNVILENKTLTCKVCGFDTDEIIGMSCGHLFCKDCYYHHIRIKIDEGESLHLKCMQHDCKMRLLPDICIRLSFTDLVPKYNKYIIRHFLQYQNGIKSCIDSCCNRYFVNHSMIPYIFHITSIVRCKNTVKEHFVECPCSKRRCFHCSDEDHYPITCELLERWNELDRSEGKTMDWLLSNTKRCPKCRMSIEKNQGCRHMKCRFCTHSFCWDCMHPWETNCGYSKACNGKILEGYDRATEEKVQKATLDLQYYMHYFKSFMSQKMAVKYSIQLKEKMIQKSHDLSELHGSLHETGEYLIQALNVIIHARNVLKYMYIYTYYMTDNKLFIESIQGDFLNKIDYLTSLTEKPIAELNKIEIMNSSSRLQSEVVNIHSLFH